MKRTDSHWPASSYVLAQFCGGKQLCQYQDFTKIGNGKQLSSAVCSNASTTWWVKMQYGISINRQLGRKIFLNTFSILWRLEIPYPIWGRKQLSQSWKVLIFWNSVLFMFEKVVEQQQAMKAYIGTIKSGHSRSQILFSVLHTF